MSDESSVRAAGGPSVPRWVQIVDAGALASVALAGCIAVGSGVRSDLFGGRITILNPAWPLSAAAFLVLVRHWWFRRPSLVDRIVTLLRDEAIATGLTTAVVTRLLVYAIGLYAVFALGYSVKPLPFVVSDTAIGNLQGRWDAGWYLTITRDGYRFDPNYHRQQNIAFFPAYPWLVRLGGPIFGRSDRDVMTAGTVLSFIAFSLALVRLYRLVKELPAAEHRPDAARAAVLLVAVYPFAVFFGAVYTESLFLLCAVSAFLYAERGRWDLVAPWGLLAGLARPNGVFLCVPLAWMAIAGLRTASHGWWRSAGVRLAAAATPALGLGIFCAYMYWLTGNPLQWMLMHDAWGRHFTGIRWLTTPMHYIWSFGVEEYVRAETANALNLAAVGFSLLLLVPVTRRLGLAYGLFIAANLLPPLMRGGLLSMGRLTATLFPMFIWLGISASERTRDRWLVAFAMGQAVLAMLFYTWRPPY